MKKTLAGRWAVALVALGLFATTATAGPIQKFDFAGSGGTIAYTQSPGSSFDAMGTINTVQRLPGGSGIVSISGGSMDIVTGVCTNAGNGCFTPNGNDQLVLTFANSASNGIVVFGGISKYGIPDGSELFAGQLMKTGVVLNGPSAPVGPDTGSLAGQISATFINAALLAGLGLSPTNSSNPLQSIAQLNFSFTVPAGVFGVQGQTIGGLGLLTDSSIMLTDLSITAVPASAVPEPASLILFGSSVLLAAGALRRKLRLG
jgi:PEP-CTERM motif